jgi:4'-phosphopantetheinyl transferase
MSFPDFFPAASIPESGVVDVWLIDLDRAALRHGGLLRLLLSADELRRAERFRFPEHRRRYIASRGLLRTLIGVCLDIDPVEVKFTYGEHGKPFVGTLPFNSSDSASSAAIAISAQGEIGIDVERVREMPSGLRFANRFFSPPEAEAIDRGPDPDRVFFACWTRKEAYIKAIGTGLSHPLDQFAVGCDPDDPRPSISGVGGEWSIRSFDAAGPIIGAVCRAGGDFELRIRPVAIPE